MSDKTKINWTDATWNPVSGCTPVSPGCAHCYAARLAKRLPAVHCRCVAVDPSGPRAGEAEEHPFSVVHLHPDRLTIPLHWRKTRRVFVCSMGDLFHPDVPFDFIAAVFGVMAACPQHRFQLLTKRPARMLAWFEWIDSVAAASSRHVPGHRHVTALFSMTTIAVDTQAWRDRYGRSFGEQIGAERWPLPNVWLGVTAEDQQRADERIPLLLRCPAAVRFVSCEPLIGPVSLIASGGIGFVPATGAPCQGKALNWAICGGESGPGARPMDPDWARSLRDQCGAAGVPFFYKQQGGNGVMRHWRMLDGVMHNAFPEVTP